MPLEGDAADQTTLASGGQANPASRADVCRNTDTEYPVLPRRVARLQADLSEIFIVLMALIQICLRWLLPPLRSVVQSPAAFIRLPKPVAVAAPLNPGVSRPLSPILVPLPRLIT